VGLCFVHLFQECAAVNFLRIGDYDINLRHILIYLPIYRCRAASDYNLFIWMFCLQATDFLASLSLSLSGHSTRVDDNSIINAVLLHNKLKPF
jgi:hypothetical protein